MLAWLRQLFGAKPDAMAKAAAAPAAAAPRARPSPAPAVPPAAQAAAASAAGAVYGVQRPLVGRKGGIAGFECTLPPRTLQRLAAQGQGTGAPAAVAHHALLLAQLAPLMAAGRTALTVLPAAMLARPVVAEAAVAGAWLCVDALPTLPPPVAQALRGRGVLLGVGDSAPQQAAQADFAWLHGSDADTLQLALERWRELRPQTPVVVTGLSVVDDVERLLRAGAQLAGGQLQRRRGGQDKPLNAVAHRICELMNHLALDRETAVVAEAVRADVALAYRLITYANSPALGLTRRVDSIEQALALLGRQELTRWLQVLLLSSAASRQAAPALQEQALARGRLLEHLARAERMPSPSSLFSVGVFSMLESLFELPLAQAVAPLRLGDEARGALLLGSGPWAPHLQLAVALDGGDARAAEQLAARWGGVQAVQPWVDDAWAWAARMSENAVPARPRAVAAV